jgi:hypothetical protein
MSAQELEYAQGFQEMMQTYFLDSGLGTFPKALHSFDDQVGNLSMVVKPNMEASVVCKVLDTIGEVQLHAR